MLAVKILVDRGMDIECAFVGWQYAPYVEQMQATIHQYGLYEDIRLAEYHHNPYPLFLQADCVVVCTRGEAFGRVAAEAMVLGVPVVATRVLGLELVVREGETALAYDVGEPEELAACIERLALDPDLRRRLVRGGQDHMASFTPQDYGGAVWKLLAGLKGRRAAPNRGVAELTQSWSLDALSEKTREHAVASTQHNDLLTRQKRLKNLASRVVPRSLLVRLWRRTP